MGDYKITFTLDDSNGGDASVEFYTRRRRNRLTPVSLISAPVHIDSGTHEVIWRTMRQMSNQLYSDIVLYARATDLVNYGPQDSFPTTIDNGWIESKRRRHRIGQIHRGRARRLGHTKAQ